MDLYLSSKILFDRQIETVIELIVERGYDGLELWSEHFLNLGYRDPLAQSELIELLREAPFPLWIHGPTMDLNITSANPRVAQVSLEENIRAIELAHLLEAKGVVIHPGSLSAPINDVEMEEYWDRQLAALRRLARAADCLLAVENMESRDNNFIQEPSDLKRILENIPRSNLGICFDIAHSRSLGNTEEFLEKMAPDITHIHYSNSGTKSIHAPIDRGESNLPQPFLSFLEDFSGVLTFEGRDPAREREVAENYLDLFLQTCERSCSC